jgi:hypothetical protein
LSYLLHKLFFKRTDFGGCVSPERASNFELLKEFQAAQNTTCHLLSANTISLIDCIEIYRIEFLNDSSKLVSVSELCHSCM